MAGRPMQQWAIQMQISDPILKIPNFNFVDLNQSDTLCVCSDVYIAIEQRQKNYCITNCFMTI